MNNKPTIIDEINVSECEHFTQEQPQFDITCLFNAFKNKNKCEDSPNCYYKQLQRKKQECEKLRKINQAWGLTVTNLREELETLQQTYEACEKEYKKLYEKYLHVLDMAKQNADSYEYCLRELEEQNEKLVNAIKAIEGITNLLKTKPIWHSIDEVDAEFDKILEIVKKNTSNDGDEKGG